jgi:WD40 repeat protein
MTMNNAYIDKVNSFNSISFNSTSFNSTSFNSIQPTNTIQSKIDGWKINNIVNSFHIPVTSIITVNDIIVTSAGSLVAILHKGTVIAQYDAQIPITALAMTIITQSTPTLLSVDLENSSDSFDSEHSEQLEQSDQADMVDSHHIVAVGTQKSITLLSLNILQSKYEAYSLLSGHEEAITHLAFSPTNPRFLISTSKDTYARLFYIATPPETHLAKQDDSIANITASHMVALFYGSGIYDEMNHFCFLPPEKKETVLICRKDGRLEKYHLPPILEKVKQHANVRIGKKGGVKKKYLYARPCFLSNDDWGFDAEELMQVEYVCENICGRSPPSSLVSRRKRRG